MSKRLAGRNEYLKCSFCGFRIDCAVDLDEARRNLLIQFGAPRCPRCRGPKMDCERYTVWQLPVRRPVPAEATQPEGPAP